MLEEYKNKYNQLKGRKTIIQKSIDDISDELKKEKRNLRNIETAQVIIQKVAQQTQQELEYHISDVVTTALTAVFGPEYELSVKFILKRNKTEVEIKLLKDGQLLDPMESCGGGVIDIISFALRIALWSLKKPRTRNTIVMDEPFRFVSRDYLSSVSEIIKMLSKKLNLQMIIVTHIKELEEGANKLFEVNIKRGISKVVEL